MYNRNKRQRLLYTHILLMAFLNWSLGFGSRNIMFTGTPHRKLKSGQVLDSVTAYSMLHCAAVCTFTEHCLSVSYKSTTNNCLLSYLPTVAIPLFTDENDDWETFSTDGHRNVYWGSTDCYEHVTVGRFHSGEPIIHMGTSTVPIQHVATCSGSNPSSFSGWLLAFRAPKGIGGDVLDSFVDGDDVTTDHVGCIDLTSTACLSNYRHPILNNWDVANITKVRFSYYKSQAEVAYVEFNTSGSSMTSWFERDRILDSTWTTIATDTYEVFGLDDTGSIYAYPNRRFFIQLNYGGCAVDRIYSLAVTHEVVTFSCNVDRQSSYPQFVYASSSSPGYPQSGSGTDKADFMAIFVKA